MHFECITDMLAEYDENWYLDRENPDDMGTLVTLVKDAAEAGFFRALGAGVDLLVQTVGDEIIPVLLVSINAFVWLSAPGLSIDDVVDSGSMGAEQASAILRNVHTLAAQTIVNHKARYTPVPPFSTTVLG